MGIIDDDAWAARAEFGPSTEGFRHVEAQRNQLEAFERPYIGAATQALEHFRGPDGMGSRDITNEHGRILELNRLITAELDRYPRVPVLFVYPEFNSLTGKPSAKSSLANVAGPHVLFRSTSARSSTDDGSVDIDTRSLALGAEAATIRGNILSPGVITDYSEEVHGLVLCSTMSLSGEGDQTQATGDSTILGNETLVLVGWQDIEAAFLQRIEASGHSDTDVLHIRNLLHTVGHLNNIDENAPELAKRLDNAWLACLLSAAPRF
jgi:hypothetical protein